MLLLLHLGLALCILLHWWVCTCVGSAGAGAVAVMCAAADMGCCCMFCFGLAVAHVTVDAILHVLLHSAGVVAALYWCGCCICYCCSQYMYYCCYVSAAACCCECTCCCIRCYPHVCVCPTKDTAIPFVAFGVIAATVAFIVVAACAIAYALLLKG